MDDKNNISIREIRSPEMQDVMTEIPGRFLRWGLLLFFGILAAILGVSWFISYPDVVTAPVTLTTWNPPVALVARSGGKIERIFSGNGTKVAAHQPVALISNQARWDDVCIISAIIDSLPGIATDESIVIKITLPQVSVLGEMQDQWVRFTAAIVSYKDYLLSDYLPEKVKLLGKQIVRQEEYIIELKHQQKLTEEDLLLTVNSYKRDSILFHNSNYSISINEFERSRQALLQKKVAYSTLVSSIRNTESSALKLRESRLDLNNQYDKEISRYKSEISASTELLKSALGGWKERYLIESPVTGTLSYTTFWRENQVINAGEALATVVPDDPAKMIIRAYVPVSGAGKVKPGQMVNISLSGYPDMEYGLLKGRVSTLSLVPVKDAYIADIELTNGMTTTYNQELVFINDMTGKAGIITEESRLIFRLIKPLRSFFSK